MPFPIPPRAILNISLLAGVASRMSRLHSQQGTPLPSEGWLLGRLLVLGRAQSTLFSYARDLLNMVMTCPVFLSQP
jgi:hypothetical protein